MKKRLLLSIPGLLLFLILLVVFVPARMGHLVYETSTNIERRIYGLEQSQVDIGEMKISLYQNELANRETILMVHGFSADKDNWIRFARYFSDDFNIVIPDLAGHGETGFEESWDYTMPAQADRLAKLIEQMNIEKVHIIGNSMGGFISAYFAKTYPQHTLSLTLVDTAGVTSPIPSDMNLMLAQGRNPFEIHNRQEFDSFYAMTMEKPPYAPDFVLEAISEKYQQEMVAMAEATEYPLEEIQLTNVFPALFHCSGFALYGDATVKGKLLHGRVLDYMIRHYG